MTKRRPGGWRYITTEEEHEALMNSGPTPVPGVDYRVDDAGDIMVPTVVQCSHDCGMCDGPLVYDGQSGEYATWVCQNCGHWHIAMDCCHQLSNLTLDT